MVKTILLVDDANDFLNSLTELLRSHGYFVSEHSSPREALESCRVNEEVTPQFAELELPGTDGDSLQAEVRRIYPTVEELLVTGNIRWWGPPASDNIDSIEDSFSSDDLLRALENQLVS